MHGSELFLSSQPRSTALHYFTLLIVVGGRAPYDPRSQTSCVGVPSRRESTRVEREAYPMPGFRRTSVEACYMGRDNTDGCTHMAGFFVECAEIWWCRITSHVSYGIVWYRRYCIVSGRQLTRVFPVLHTRPSSYCTVCVQNLRELSILLLGSSLVSCGSL